MNTDEIHDMIQCSDGKNFGAILEHINNKLAELESRLDRFDPPAETGEPSAMRADGYLKRIEE